MIIDQTIIALDQMNKDEIDQFLLLVGSRVRTIKIGLELFLRYGKNYVEFLHTKYNKDIFLDLKLHDIPVTVEKAIQSLEGLPIKFLTIHLGGGHSMAMSAARQAQKSLPDCRLLGVSFLTSLEPADLDSIYGIKDSKLAFTKMFKIAYESGIHGVVCSPHEISILKDNFPTLLAITPGIRFEDEINLHNTHDQKRTSNPVEAITNGADFIVIGRSLTKAADLEARLKQLSIRV